MTVVFRTSDPTTAVVVVDVTATGFEGLVFAGATIS